MNYNLTDEVHCTILLYKKHVSFLVKGRSGENLPCIILPQ